MTGALSLFRIRLAPSASVIADAAGGTTDSSAESPVERAATTGSAGSESMAGTRAWTPSNKADDEPKDEGQTASEPADEIDDGSEPIIGTEVAKADDDQDGKADEGEMNAEAVRRAEAVFGKAKVQSALKRGSEAFAILSEMAEEQLGEFSGNETPADEPKAQETPKTKAEPEPKAEQKPETKADSAASAFQLDPEALEEVKAILGDHAYDKAIAPMVKALQEHIPQQFSKIVQYAETLRQEQYLTRVDAVIDRMSDPMFGDSFDDLNREQTANREAVRTTAETIWSKAKNAGKPISGARALTMAAEIVRSTGGGKQTTQQIANKQARQDVQKQLTQRNRAVGAVPRRSSNTTRQTPNRSPAAAQSAVAAKLKDLGISDPDA